jgi:UDP-glucuronate 4-epimerase
VGRGANKPCCWRATRSASSRCTTRPPAPAPPASNGTLRFASQVKALLAGGQIDTAPEPAGHTGFFLWGSVPAPYTLYRGIRALPAGHYLWVSGQGATEPVPFCQITDILAHAAANPARGTQGDALDAIGAAVRDSIAAHHVADVPVGMFLSAGIDSALITELSVAHGERPHTLTLAFAEYVGSANDESPLAEQLAAQLGTRHATVMVRKEDFQAQRDQLLAAMDQPSIDGVNTWFVSQAAASLGIKLALSGLEGDEPRMRRMACHRLSSPAQAGIEGFLHQNSSFFAAFPASNGHSLLLMNNSTSPETSQIRPWLVTGAAGFIGMHTALRLLERGDTVIGVDNLNDYYDIALKEARLAELRKHENFSFHKLDIANREAMSALFATEQPRRVIHLAAQAGVRYSIDNPNAYIDSNLVGFGNILEGCRHNAVEHLVFASSSSVYGGNTAMPFSEHHNVDHPISLYAATKKANEMMAHAYSHLYRLPVTGLRFFTVYGPWGRPDMAPTLFANDITQGRAINVFNGGNLQRDFTYIDDIVEGVIRVADKPATPNPAFDPAHPDPATSSAPYRLLNIGNNQAVPLMEFIKTMEAALGLVARKNFRPMQAGDVLATAANTDELDAWVGFKPGTPLIDGIARFVAWYRGFYAAQSNPCGMNCSSQQHKPPEP